MRIRFPELLTAGTIAALSTFTVSTAPAAAITLFEATLEGTQEVPPVDTPAFGSASLSLDETTDLFDIQIDVTGIETSDLLGVGPNASPLHIHLAPAGSNGPIVVDLGFLGTPVPTPTGFSFTLEDALFGGLQGDLETDADDNVAALLAGNTYVNIHTSAFPSGEIRGQLEVVPEPAMALALIAVTGIGSLLRRQGNTEDEGM